jgi:enhancing lycopene biosynthesis protein 2
MNDTPKKLLSEAELATRAARDAIRRLKKFGIEKYDIAIARGALRHARKALRRFAVLAARACVHNKAALR